MYPLIVVSHNKKQLDKYLKEQMKKHKVPSYNVFTIEPEKDEISINQIRQVKKDLLLSTAQKRLIIMYHFDSASTEAQNALLKTLEEKDEQTLFFLLVENSENVLPTIRSRSQTVSLVRSQDQMEIKQEWRHYFNQLSKDRYAFLSNKLVLAIDKDKALSMFDNAILHFRQTLIDKHEKSSADIIKKAFIQKALLINNNLNPQLTVDAFLIFIKKRLQNR